jgi:phospholipase/carboxylesterase
MDRFQTGIHHVTLITRCVQANVDFYVGFLGLRLVKRTGGYEDATQLHLFYGDRSGTPGSLVTFLVWENGGSGRVGNGQVAEIAFAIPPESIGEWLTKALRFGLSVEGPNREFGETVLRLKDPDGVIVKLVGADIPAGDPWGEAVSAIRRLRSVTILTEEPEQTASFLRRFGYRDGVSEGNSRRMVSQTDAVDVRDATGYVPGAAGTGTADHVAFRARDVDAVRAAEALLSGLNSSPTTFHDRNYFTSLYVREPGGTLIELATDGPGFTKDEPIERLGETLFAPPSNRERQEEIRVLLPQFALPGQPRMPMRELPFVHRLFQPDEPDGSTMILLHGTGGDEAEMMPLAHRIAPRATLVGLRGRATEDGSRRWFRALSSTRFDQADIASEAEAFAAFMVGATPGYGINPATATFLGYSNGANFLGSVMGLQPDIVRRAILLRPRMTLDPPPIVDLSGVRALIVEGRDDPIGGCAGKLEIWLRASGAAVESVELGAGHGLVAEDAEAASRWLEQ